MLSKMSKDDVLLRLSLSRVASSLSRTGIHAAFDKIIDLAIALEIMYQLDASRGKGGLRWYPKTRQLAKRESSS